MPRSAGSTDKQSDTPQLSEIESEAMDILWGADHALTANEVVTRIFQGRHAAARDLPNYTTIASMLTRLVSRDLLESTKVSPRNIVYAPKMKRAEYAARALQQIFRRILKRDLGAVLPNLGQAVHADGRSSSSAKLSEDPEIQQLLQEIEHLQGGSK